MSHYSNSSGPEEERALAEVAALDAERLGMTNLERLTTLRDALAEHIARPIPRGPGPYMLSEDFAAVLDILLWVVERVS